MVVGSTARDDSRAIFLIHGAGGGAFEWLVWERVLTTQGWAVHAPTWQPAPGGLAATRYADYLAQLQAAIAGSNARPILIGASLGGLFAMELAEGVGADALVLINPIPPKGAALALLPELNPAAIEPWADTASLSSTARAIPDASPATWHWLWRQWRNESGTVLREARAGREIARPDMPGLVVISDQDRDVPAAASRAFAAHWQLETVALPSASHVGPLLGASAAQVALRVHHWLAYRLGAPKARAI